MGNGSTLKICLTNVGPYLGPDSKNTTVKMTFKSIREIPVMRNYKF